VAALISGNAQALTSNFNITYDGVVDTLDPGSDNPIGTTLSAGDGIVLDFRAAGVGLIGFAAARKRARSAA
jgi:hypothetical protein